RGHAGRLRLRLPGDRECAERLGSAPAAADGGPGRGRLPGRLHQDLPAAIPGTEPHLEDDRSGSHRHRLRRPGPAVPERPVPHPGQHPDLLHPGPGPRSGLRRYGTGADPGRDPGALPDHRLVRRRQPPPRYSLPAPHAQCRTPASTHISFTRVLGLDLAFAGTVLGLILFVIWANFLITAWSNAVNLTDGLDGLATGASMFVFGAYTLVTIWQMNQNCQVLASVGPSCYEVRDPRDLSIIAAAIVGACFGFLWWNASPAKIFMGDTGSLALGGALAGMTILTRTELLGAIIGGLFVLVILSDVIQIGFFKATGRRVFKMAPLHHHFELMGWGEVTIVIRFWIIAALFVCLGVGLFYAEWIVI